MVSRILKYVILAILVAASGAAYSYTHILRSIFIEFGGFNNVGKNLYISDELDKNARNEVVALIEGARARIKQYYGDPQANPVIIVAANESEAKDYGLIDTPGIFFFTPWQGYLVINYSQKSIDVIAHELLHAEIVDRLDYFLRQKEIPTWFDEGAALQIDLRKQYMIEPTSFDPTEIQRVIQLDSPGEFWSDNKEQNIRNYRASKAAVAMVLRAFPSRSLYSLLARVRDGEGFGEVFMGQTNTTLQPTSGRDAAFLG